MTPVLLILPHDWGAFNMRNKREGEQSNGFSNTLDSN